MRLTLFRGVEITEEAVEQEKKIVYEEWRLSQNAAGRSNFNELKIMLSGSSYADRFPIGREETIRNCTREQLQAFYQKVVDCEIVVDDW